MGRPPIGPRAMTGAERLRRHRAKVRAARPQPEVAACAWCGRSGCMLVGEGATMICAQCIGRASVEIAEARAAKKRAVDLWGDDAIDPLPDSTPSP
jgi:hypothetical protein